MWVQLCRLQTIAFAIMFAFGGNIGLNRVVKMLSSHFSISKLIYVSTNSTTPDAFLEAIQVLLSSHMIDLFSIHLTDLKSKLPFCKYPIFLLWHPYFTSSNGCVELNNFCFSIIISLHGWKSALESNRQEKPHRLDA